TRPIQAEIISLDREATEAGRGWIVTIDRGSSDGVDVGTVLAIYRVVPLIPDPRGVERPVRQPNLFLPNRYLKVPDERIGLVFVFRVFDRLSYAYVLQSTDPVDVGNYTRNP